MALTDTAIRALKPAAAPRKVSDAEGLHIVVTPQGSKLWRLAYRYAGKQKTLSIGAYPAVSLAEARKRREEAKASLAGGKDPADSKRLGKLATAAGHANTFETIADQYMAKLKRDGRSQATLDKLAWLYSLAIPAIGKRPIAEIKAPEILAILQKAEARGNLETAKRLRGSIGAVIRYAVATARADHDPTSALKGAISSPKVRHRPAITDPVAFGALMRAIDGFDGQPSTRAALQLLPMVFTRPSELRLATWAEFDLEKAIWTIPAVRTKMRREHKVPLARQAIEVLTTLQQFTGAGLLVFPGTRTHDRPISENTINAALRRLGYTGDEMVAHGFRASASTLLNESGKFSSDAIERALAHQDPDPVRRAYARGTFWTERVEMMQWWADHIATLRSGGDLLRFPSKFSA